MDIKAIGFDVGHTLIAYQNPLSWKSLYSPALRNVMSACHIPETKEKIEKASSVLSKYNTRENAREYEVTSDHIFKEIFDAWGENYSGMDVAKGAFYSFFQADAVCFDDAEETLNNLFEKGISLGFLTDVAYGMDNEYALKDIETIKQYFSAGFTSVDIGYRKPHKAGYEALLQKFDILPGQMLYVGDEEKDITGANRAGILSVLINRGNDNKDWGQLYTIHNLSEILCIVQTQGGDPHCTTS
jgi:putative hydrolase of the HAD superfamily